MGLGWGACGVTFPCDSPPGTAPATQLSFLFIRDVFCPTLPAAPPTPGFHPCQPLCPLILPKQYRS